MDGIGRRVILIGMPTLERVRCDSRMTRAGIPSIRRIHDAPAQVLRQRAARTPSLRVPGGGDTEMTEGPGFPIAGPALAEEADRPIATSR